VGDNVEGFVGGLARTIHGALVTQQEGMKQLNCIRSDAIRNHQRKHRAEVGFKIEPNAKEVGPRLDLTGSATQENESGLMLVTMDDERFI
jgi:hypothetical protein